MEREKTSYRSHSSEGMVWRHSCCGLRSMVGWKGAKCFFFSQNFQSPISLLPRKSDRVCSGPLTGSLALAPDGRASLPFHLSLTPELCLYPDGRPLWVPLKERVWSTHSSRKADRPVYLWIDNGEVKFEKAASLWGKETTETTVAIQEEKGIETWRCFVLVLQAKGNSLY